MNLIKYFGIQFVLFGVIILTNFYLDSYISKPFTYVDLIAIIIGASIIILSLNLYNKLKKRLKPIRLFEKILISVLAIIIATIFIGVLTGEMQF
jgi:peptidoglycan/LPS O-acetylase OafA/YrhL